MKYSLFCITLVTFREALLCWIPEHLLDFPECRFLALSKQPGTRSSLLLPSLGIELIFFRTNDDGKKIYRSTGKLAQTAGGEIPIRQYERSRPYIYIRIYIYTYIMYIVLNCSCTSLIIVKFEKVSLEGGCWY
jgi:hypothetical protein